MRKVVSHLIGGLGNQMFQYATGLAVAQKNGAQLYLDTSDFSWYRRPYTLSSFRISALAASAIDHMQLLAWHGRYSPLKKFDQRRAPRNRAVRSDPGGYRYSPELLDLGARTTIWLVGHWQNEKYFISVRAQLLKEFSLKPEISVKDSTVEKKISDTISVAVHIRRGDNLVKPDHKDPSRLIPQLGMVSTSYIGNSMKMIKGREPGSIFYIFSDEIEWVKEHFQFPYPVEFIDQKNLLDVQQFELMSLCKHQIIANSTFSWWAAWLNQNPEKIICAPKKWDARFPDLDISQFIPASWELID